MNSNFKVVFNKARGALMVANEITSSVQAKGTKTVVAAAVAMAISGTALAASQYVEAPASGAAAFTTTTTIDKLKAENVFTYAPTGDKKQAAPLLATGADKTLTVAADQTIWVIGNNANAQATGLWSSGSSKSGVENKGTIYVTTNAASGGVTWQNRAMGVDKGTATNNGVIVAKDAYGMTVGSSGDKDTAKIVNGVNGKIYVEDRGVGIELGGVASGSQTKAEATNYGEIYASAAKDFGTSDKNGKFTNAVQIKGDANNLLSGQKFVNEESGKIYAADASSAVYVQYTSGAQVINNGLIEGKIIVDANASGTQLTFDTASVTKGNLELKGTGTVINAPTNEKEAAAVISGDILAQAGSTSQIGKLVADNLAVGVAQTSGASGTAGTYTLNAGATLGVKTVSVANGTLNVTGDKAALTTDELTLASGTSGSVSTSGALTTGKFTNNGTVTISGAKSALTVTGEAANNASGTVALENSGAIVLAEGSTFKNAGTISGTGTLTVAGTLTNIGTLNVSSTTVKGTLNNTSETVNGVTTAGNVSGTSLTVDGVVNTKFDNYTVTMTTVNEGGTLNVLELNSKKASGATTNDQLKLVQGVTLKGGKLTVAGADFAGNLLLDGSAAEFLIDGGDYTAKAVDFGTSGGKVTVQTGSYTVDSLNTTNGTVTVGDEGTLTVTTKLTAVSGASSAPITVDGTLSTKLSALGYVYQTSGSGSLTTVSGGATAGAGSVQLNNGGELVITDIGTDTLTKTEVTTLKSLTVSGSTGLVNVGSVNVKELTAALASGNGKIAVGDLITGVTNDQLADATVTGVTADGITGGGNFKTLELASGTTTTAVVDNTTLKLNGTGDLVTYASGSGTALADVTIGVSGTLVTTGEGAVIGAVSNSGNGTELQVASGSLEVKGNVDVATLTVDGKLAVNEKPAVPASGETAAVDAVPYTVTTRNLEVSEGGAAYVQHDLTLHSGSGTADVFGSLTVDGTLTANGRTIYVGDDEHAGTLVVNKLVSGKIFADPSWENGVEKAKVAVKTIDVNSRLEAGRNSIVAVGTTNVAEAEKAVADAGFKLGQVTQDSNGLVNSAVYVAGTSTTNPTTGVTTYSKVEGEVVAQGGNTPATTLTNVTINGGSLLVINAEGMDKTGESAVFSKLLTLNAGASFYIDNIVNGDKIKLSDTGVSLNDGVEVVYDGDLVMNFEAVSEGSTVYGMTMADEDIKDFGMNEFAGFDAAYAMFEQGLNHGTSSSVEFNNWLYTSTSHGDDLTIPGLRKIANDVASLGATTGVQTLTMDAVNQMADTVATRNSILTQRAQGVNVWADVNGGKFEAKKLFDGAGYSSDIYSGVLGLDYQFSCNAVLGAALTIGTADTDSKNSGVAASTDTDLVGFSVYASKTFADIWNVAADIGYMSASNDVTANGYNHAWKFSQDTDAFTVGVRGEVLTKAGAVNIVPHVGLRYTQLSTDGFEAGYVTDIDDQNIFQMPVGVALSADFETNGWTLAPKFDLSVVPTFGDKDADLKLGINGVSATDDLSVRVIDSNPVQATLGINATNGDWGFGLSYKLGVGSDERMNNSFNAQVRYAF